MRATVRSVMSEVSGSDVMMFEKVRCIYCCMLGKVYEISSMWVCFV